MDRTYNPKNKTQTKAVNPSFTPKKSLNQQNDDHHKDIFSCRICLEQGNAKNAKYEPLIKPCNCSGSLEFIHESCMIQWVNTRIQKKLRLNQPVQTIHCQICKDILNISLKNKIACRRGKDFKRNLNRQKSTIILCSALIFLALVGFGFLSYFQITKQELLTELIIKGAVEACWIVLSIMMIVWLFKLIWTLFLKIEKHASKVEPKSTKIEIKSKQQNKCAQSQKSLVTDNLSSIKTKTQKSLRTDFSSVGNLNPNPQYID